MSEETTPEKQDVPESHRKLYMLVALAGLVIFLFWIWTLPLNFHGNDANRKAGDLFGPIGDTVEEGRERIPSRDTNE